MYLFQCAEAISHHMVHIILTHAGIFFSLCRHGLELPMICCGLCQYAAHHQSDGCISSMTKLSNTAYTNANSFYYLQPLSLSRLRKSWIYQGQNISLSRTL